jgi:N-acetylmuramoyl-L-alanine amidase
VRCHTHYFQAVAERKLQTVSAEGATGSPLLECRIHTQELIAEGNNDMGPHYPCCGGSPTSAGCVPADHLPIYQLVDGQVRKERKIEYDPRIDLKAGRWTQTTMPLKELAKNEGFVAAAMEAAEPGVTVPKPALASSSSSSSSTVPSGAAISMPSNLAQLADPVQRVGDEIMICGQLYHTGTPVILWGDVGGYDAYRVERRFYNFDESDWATTQKELPDIFTTPNRFGLRKNGLTPAQIEAVRGGQWDLPTLQSQMMKLVLHFDEAGLSKECFTILQDQRDLSVHFMCDIDGTIYQTLDLKERAWHATIANTNSVGIEIANIGAYDPTQPNPLAQWYAKDASGQTYITIPAEYGDGGVHTKGFVGHPSRNDVIPGNIQQQNLVQYDYTPQQYAALQKLLAVFTTIFPSVPLDYPKDSSGQLITVKLPDDQLNAYKGIMGHYHIQTNKVDPGPALQWDRLIEGAKEIKVKAKKAKEARAAVVVAAAAVEQVQSASKERVAELNAMRRMEKRLISAAEHACPSANSAFYLIPTSWWQSVQSWVSCVDASLSRPCAVPTLTLLENDERTPRAGLKIQKDYKPISEPVWKELMELYGEAKPIVRKSADIYEGCPIAISVAASSGASSVPVSLSSSAISSSSGSSRFIQSPALAAAYAVPVISTESDDPWVVVVKRS